MNSREQDPVLDRIDAELHTALGIRPSPDLLVRVRRQVQDQLYRGFLPGWLIPVAAGALAVAVGVTMLPTKARQEAPAMKTEPVARAVSPVVEPNMPKSAEPRPVIVQRASPQQLRSYPIEPEVLVPAGQEQAIHRYVARMRNLRASGAVLPEEGRELAVTPLQALAPLELAPLAADPETQGAEHD
jgi:hypothetical protein